jgi:hypothetical protein
MEVKDFTPQLDMVNAVRREIRMRRSVRLARAVAVDFYECFGSEAVATESETKNGNPSVFIRAMIYSVGNWEKFLKKEDAEEFANAYGKAISKYWARNKTIKNHWQDFGLIETMEILINHQSQMKNTMEVYEKLAVSVKFGI